MTPSRQRSGRSRKGGFTLLELLVVIAIIALLVAMAIPSLRGVLDYVRSSICKSNLHELAKSLHTNTGAGSDVRLPYASAWYRHVIGHGSGGVLKCPVDDGALDFSNLTDLDVLNSLDGFVSLADVYIVQNCTLFTNIEDVLQLGTSREDPQIGVNPPGLFGSYWQSGQQIWWDPPNPGPNQDIVCIDDDGAIMITYGEKITIQSVDPPGDGGRCGSDHWIVIDDGSPTWRSEIEAVLRTVRNSGTSAANTPDPRVVMRLTGRNYANIVEPAYTVDGLRGSYGMSTAVNPISPRGGQLMLVEYNSSVVRVSGGFTNLDTLLQARHDGRANYALTDGHVDSMTIEDLELEFDSSPTRGIWGPNK